ncbi:non-ribosomal peptide synthetase [Rickettsiales endosymbiont of Stachyamoeba lipophora]|uniref:non-ribosomal peptide synthetase n=1 Tax=Rickettsiales endosymbiont of Stachyamoeba lipophora TaxID=2486578 RepID=UPI000F651FD8|nr:non-ribosomal peptide synthetase [Rickettsiales endosymbiont of Stachyamoeba lipophora]AZL16326.1 amino acid adenylation domain-containing protein [Rickettsiales endosymbiont of Stachyamoeba lipophora]
MYKIPLSPYSQSFYIEGKLNPCRNDYNIVFDQTLSGDLNVSKLCRIIRRFISSYLVFNSHIKNEDSELFWVQNNNINELDFFHDPITTEHIAQYIKQPFNLEEGPLYRFGLVKLNNNEYRLIIILHHLLIEGLTFNNFLDELSSFYNNQNHYVKSLAEQINLLSKLSKRQTEELKNFEKQNIQFWEKSLREIEAVNLNFLKFNEDKFSSNSANKRDIDEIRFHFEKDVILKLNELRDKYNLTAYMFSQIVWAILYYRYTNQNRFAVSYPLSLKEDKGLLFGAQINVSFIPYDFTQASTPLNIIEQIKAFLQSLRIEGINYKYFPTANIISLTNKNIIDFSFVQANLKNHLLNFEYITSRPNNELTNIDFINQMLFDQEIENDKVNFRIRFKANIINKTLLKDFIENYKGLFIQILDDLISDNNNPKKIEDYELALSKQYKEIIDKWNATDKEFEQELVVSELFARVAQEYPNNIAVRYDDISITYKELNERSNQLANYLRNIGVDRGTLVVLVLERSIEMIISILAVLKVGGAYIPLDPSYSTERLEFVINDTQAPIIITDEASIDKLPMTFARVICLEEEIDYISKESVNEPSFKTKANDLAYIIYTSGTTGKPKGVMIEHNGLLNTTLAISDHRKINNDSRLLSTAPYVFDSFAGELYPALVSGACLFVTNEAIRKELITIYDYCNRYEITHLFLTTKLAEEFLCLEVEKLKLKNLTIAGEKLNKVKIPNFDIINEYGPTENSICTTQFKLKPNSNNIFIGTPISNTKCYVLDKNLKILPIGAIGELYIGGVGIARGYLSRPDLTAERFIANPFQSEEEKRVGKNARLYKTGDLVRWLPDGNIEYIGRKDFQVKIRGYRIELEEIEKVILDYPGIIQSAVILREILNNGEVYNKYLIAYYVSEKKIEAEKISQFLFAKLPEYMVPAIFIQIESLPLTINGKLDKAALPDPIFTNKNDYIAPRNEIEKELCRIWSEVLNLPEDQVGINDDFFKLGGNSILAIKLIYRINELIGKIVSISSIFENSTTESLANYIVNSNEEGHIIEKKVVNIEQQVLSFGQERLWFIDRYEGGTNVYNAPLVFKIASDVNIKLLEQSIKSIIRRHEILRTIIRKDNNGNYYQLVLEYSDNNVQITKTNLNNKQNLNQELEKDLNYKFDLSNEYPIKIAFYQVAVQNGMEYYDEVYLSIIIHHIAFDGWSIDIFTKEVLEFYQYYLNLAKGIRANLNLPELNVQYKDFALWQRNFLIGKALEKQLSYWKDKLIGYESLNLLTDKPRPALIDYKGKDLEFELDEITSNNLRELAKELKVSLYTLLLSAYCLMLKVYSNQNDLIIGTPLANRHYNQVANLIGFFVNTLPLRLKVDDAWSIKEFINYVNKEVLELQLHQDLPFEKLVEELQTAKDTSRHPIFQIMFGVQNFYISDENNHVLLACKNKTDNFAKFDVTTLIDDSKVKLTGTINYSLSLFNETTLKEYIETYITILKQFSNLGKNPNQFEDSKLSSIHYLNDKRYQQIIYEWNQTNKEYPIQATINQLFEEQAKQFPERTAIVFKDTKLTYKELNEKANILANHLIEVYHIKANDLVIILMDRDENIIISILAILKAGDAYIPVDPCYPENRIRDIIEDSQPKFILTTDKFKEQAQKYQVNIIDIGEIIRPEQTILNHNPITYNTSNDLAYVIYTSGTTGKPKGVMVEHRGVINLIAGMKLLYSVSPQNCLWFSNYVFDAHIEEIFSSLLNGHTLHIISNEIRYDLILLSKYIKDNSINIATIPPALLDNKNILSLSTLILAGDKSDKNIVKSYLEHNVKVINAYGPSEVTVCSTFNKSNGNNVSNIGKPINNVKAYVLDSNLQPLPIGAIGELYIGGAGVARGYLNRPDLTQERFIANPFQSEEEKKLGKNDRLYKTGDLVRWLPDGSLEYIGRNDFQVKIRGYRIELGEIEAVLTSYPGIKQSVVIVKESTENNGEAQGSKYLVGYYVAEEEIDEEQLRKYLEDKLPEYMVPTIVVALEYMPLTVNGKIDRKVLPELILSKQDNYVAPRNELEKELCAIWSEVLGIGPDKISIQDDFFKLGGNSILAMKLTNLLNSRLNINIKVLNIFIYKNIEKLTNKVITPLIEQLSVEDEYEVLDV